VTGSPSWLKRTSAPTNTPDQKRRVLLVRSFLRAVILAVVGLAAVSACLAIVVVAVPLSRYPADKNVASEGANTAAVVAQQTDLGRESSLTVVWGEERSFYGGPTLIGRITGLSVKPGRSIGCSVSVIEVDGVDRRALCGEVPPWRDVQPGNTTEDAEEVWQLLQELGLLNEGERSSRAEYDAIIRYQRLTGAEPTGVVGANAFIWIGQPVTPGEVPVVPGQKLLEGTPLFKSAAGLVSAVATRIDRSEPQVFSRPGVKDVFEVHSDGSVADLARLEQAIGKDSSGKLPTTVPGRIGLRDPLAAMVVPPASLTGSGRRLCVITVDQTRFIAVAVDLIESTPTSSLVTGDLRPGQAVRIDPEPSTSC
jgi:hypothetical protein